MQSDQKLFMEKMLGLERQAKDRGGILAPEDIEAAFEGAGWTGDQMEEICRYFEARGIRIRGRTRAEEDDPSDRKISVRETRRDQDMVALYRKEMEAAFHFKEGQEEELLIRLCQGDAEARDLLVEGYLPMAMKIAQAYRGRGLMQSDLIQECNLGLLMAVSEYNEDSLDFEPDLRDKTDQGKFREYLEECICAHVEGQLSEYTHSMRSARKMVRQMNRLNDTATAFARDYDREASLEELADRMGLSVDEVDRLVKSSLNAIDRTFT